MCTTIGADSSSRFHFRVRTNKQTNIQITDATEQPTHNGNYTADMGNKCPK